MKMSTTLEATNADLMKDEKYEVRHGNIFRHDGVVVGDVEKTS
jgi:hypothetical protein